MRRDNPKKHIPIDLANHLGHLRLRCEVRTRICREVWTDGGALRQACLAKESRLSHDEPELPSLWITSMSVSNSKFLGRVKVDFNQQYNALIGGGHRQVDDPRISPLGLLRPACREHRLGHRTGSDEKEKADR